MKLIILIFILQLSFLSHADDSTDKLGQVEIKLDEFNREKLVEIKFVGGLVLEDPKEDDGIVFYSDGYTQNKDYYGVRTSGNLTKDEIVSLKIKIQNTNFEDVRSRRFEGVCPTAFDGAEAVIIMYLDSHKEILSKCKFDINTSYPVFYELNSLLNKYHKSYIISN